MLGSIIVGTVIGNILVCVAVCLVRKLRRPCNYLLVSLAVSDICVALLVMPMALLYEIKGDWSFGPIWCDLWVSFDVLSCTASILNLCMISVDRWVNRSYIMRFHPPRRSDYLHHFAVARLSAQSSNTLYPASFKSSGTAAQLACKLIGILGFCLPLRSSRVVFIAQWIERRFGKMSFSITHET